MRLFFKVVLILGLAGCVPVYGQFQCTAGAVNPSAINNAAACTPLAGSGAAITSGPGSSVAGDLATFVGTLGQIQDSGVLLSSLATTAALQAGYYGGTATGAVNVLAITLPSGLGTPTLSQLIGIPITFTANLANTSATPTLTVNGLAATVIVKLSASALLGGDINTVSVAIVVYNGTNFVLQNPQNTFSIGALLGTGSVSAGSGGNVGMTASGVGVQTTAYYGWSTTTAYSGAKDSLLCRLGAAGVMGPESAATCTNTTAGATGTWVAALYKTNTACSNGANPAVCSAAPAGAVAIPTGTNPTLTVNTTAVTATLQILLQSDDTLTIASTTCNSTLSSLVGGMAVTSRTAGTSFTITFNGTLAVNPLCLSYSIIN